MNSDIESSIQSYLNALAEVLKTQDDALIHDAITDAEQHFRFALSDQALSSNNIETIIETYGTPEEIGQRYCEMEDLVEFALNGNKNEPKTNTFFYSVVKETSSYQALVFNFLSFPLGIIYFAWTVFVGVTSLFASVFIVTAPVFIFYLKSMQYFSWFEGRLIESLLGERMPRRVNLKTQFKNQSFVQRCKSLLSHTQSWTSALYLALKLPLGFVVFMLSIIPVCLSLGIILSPIVDPIIHLANPIYTVDIEYYWLPLTLPAGAIGFVLSLKLSKALAALQVSLAKKMLVRKLV